LSEKYFFGGDTRLAETKAELLKSQQLKISK